MRHVLRPVRWLVAAYEIGAMVVVLVLGIVIAAYGGLTGDLAAIGIGIGLALIMVVGLAYDLWWSERTEPPGERSS